MGGGGRNKRTKGRETNQKRTNQVEEIPTESDYNTTTSFGAKCCGKVQLY